MHDKTNIYTYSLSGRNQGIQIIELFLRYSVSLCEKTVCDILFTFSLRGIMTFNFILKSQRRAFRWPNNNMVVSFAC